ncbi:MAG: hypothetical protein J1E16_05720 [Muribaculaceae bacterium]|nr:hypothetical protein [Muribaculaceae bacterium]
MPVLDGSWNATAFFERLLAKNKLAKHYGFRFCRVSGLEGFEEALQQMQKTINFFCVSDVSDGYTDLENTPATRKVKTIFMAMRHEAENMDLREQSLDIMRELFRQLMSVLIQERTILQEKFIYIDSRIKFHEIERYFFSGGSCAYFQVPVTVFTSLCYNPLEWEDDGESN